MADNGWNLLMFLDEKKIISPNTAMDIYLFNADVGVCVLNDTCVGQHGIQSS